MKINLRGRFYYLTMILLPAISIVVKNIIFQAFILGKNMYEVNIVEAITIIGLVTAVISAIGVFVGNIFGNKYKAKAELVGGLILVLLGLKILTEHLLG